MSESDQKLSPIIIVKKKSHHQERAHSTAWKIALADFMTTMMILFFVMWIINIVPHEKKKELVSFFEGKNEMQVSGGLGMLPEKSTPAKDESYQAKIYFVLEKELKKIDPTMMIHLSRGRLEINLRSNLLFDVGKFNIKPAFSIIISKIAELIKNQNLYLDIYGYTDNTPILGGSNLILSVRRSKAAAEAFSKMGVKENRIGIHGEGERFPVSDNKTEVGRSLNRRIVLYISPMKSGLNPKDMTRVINNLDNVSKSNELENKS